MSKIITFRGKLDMGVEEKIHLSTNDGLTGYRINKFQIIGNTPGTGSNPEYIAQIFLTSQVGSIGNSVDFSDSDLLGVVFLNGNTNPAYPSNELIIFDKETFNQDIFISITDASGSTVPCNFYIELEQFKIDLNTSTYHTLKNIRSKTQ